MPATMKSAEVSVAGGISDAPRWGMWPCASKNSLKVSRISSELIAMDGEVFGASAPAAGRSAVYRFQLGSAPRAQLSRDSHP